MNRSKRVINAFINCVKSGQYTLDYAILLIEDNQKYGFLSEDDKTIFYAEFEDQDTEELEEIVEGLEPDASGGD